MSQNAGDRRTIHLMVNPLSGYGESPGAWLTDRASSRAFAEIGSYVRIAQAAERGLFDAMFLGDNPSLAGNVTIGPPEFGLEPLTLLSALSMATERIGLVGTFSTTYNLPYNTARQLRSLDLISSGRAGWNAVTTANLSAAANFGDDQVLERTERYSRAAEFIEAVRALWRSWPEEALKASASDGVFVEAGTLRPPHYRGRHLRTAGPINLPPSAQGDPVIFQAGGGAAGEGPRLAARFADAMFYNFPDASFAKARILASKADFVAACRPPARVFAGIITSVDSSLEAALERREELDRPTDMRTRAQRVATALGLGPDSASLDAALPPALLDSLVLDGPCSVANVIRRTDPDRMTMRRLVASGIDTSKPLIMGSGKEVAAQLIEWCARGEVDGFAIQPDTLPQGLDQFVRLVVPELQSRGRYRTGYQAATLRGHLEIAPV